MKGSGGRREEEEEEEMKSREVGCRNGYSRDEAHSHVQNDYLSRFILKGNLMD